jgi:hypothetical protein
MPKISNVSLYSVKGKVYVNIEKILEIDYNNFNLLNWKLRWYTRIFSRDPSNART